MSAACGQSEVIAFLSRPESYGLQGGHVERIETHCSIVFLVGDRAYKLKRAIRYADLDYMTVARRKAACAAELVLNRRTAPQLYLCVSAIYREPGGVLAFDGPGTPLDHVVVMRRFAQADLFEGLAERGQLTEPLMRALGQDIARLHAMAERTPAFGGSIAIQRVIETNARELARHAVVLDATVIGTLDRHAQAALAAAAPLLDQRRHEGKIRRCHGDLRLANICLWSGAPLLFDAIEFSDEIGCIDVLYDLAFLLMDLQLRKRTDLADIVLGAYLAQAPEQDGLPALPLFLALRAAMRSYALADSADRQSNPTQAAQKCALARLHLGAAITYLKPDHVTAQQSTGVVPGHFLHIQNGGGQGDDAPRSSHS
jgi:hypothetical protein